MPRTYIFKNAAVSWKLKLVLGFIRLCIEFRFLTMAKRFTAQLFVSRLSAYTTEQSLRQLFSPFGQIREARLIRDSQTQRPKGFSFITYESEDDAQKAMKALDGKIVNGRLIFVEAAKEVEAPTISMNSNKKLEENTQSNYKTIKDSLHQNHSRVVDCYNSKE